MRLAHWQLTTAEQNVSTRGLTLRCFHSFCLFAGRSERFFCIVAHPVFCSVSKFLIKNGREQQVQLSLAPHIQRFYLRSLREHAPKANLVCPIEYPPSLYRHKWYNKLPVIFRCCDAGNSQVPTPTTPQLVKKIPTKPANFISFAR